MCPKSSGASCGLTPAMSPYISLMKVQGPGCVQPYSTEIPAPAPHPLSSNFFFFLGYFPVACGTHCFLHNCVCVGKRPVGFIYPSGKPCRHVVK